MPLNADRCTNFDHMSTSICSLRVGLRPASLQAVSSRSSRGERRPSSSPKYEPVQCGVPDDARFGDDRHDVGRAGRDMRPPHDRDERVGAVHSVLKRNDDGIGADEWWEERNGRNPCRTA